VRYDAAPARVPMTMQAVTGSGPGTAVTSFPYLVTLSAGLPLGWGGAGPAAVPRAELAPTLVGIPEGCRMCMMQLDAHPGTAGRMHGAGKMPFGELLTAGQ